MSSASTITKSDTDSVSSGVAYAALCNGAKGYGFSLRNIANRVLSVDVIAASHAISKIMEEIEFNSLRTIKNFVIGKSQVMRRKKAGGYCDFDSSRPSTWTTSGSGSPGNRWSSTYHPGGYDGLIVFACFPRTSVPPIALAHRHDQEEYTLAIEAGLHAYYAFTAPDPRYLHTTGDGKKGKVQFAGVLYLAYKFLTPEEEEAANPGKEDDEDDDALTENADESSAATTTCVP